MSLHVFENGNHVETSEQVMWKTTEASRFTDFSRTTLLIYSSLPSNATDDACFYPPRSQVTFRWSLCLTPQGHDPNLTDLFFFHNTSVTHRPQTVSPGCVLYKSTLRFCRGFSGPSLCALCQKDGNYQKRRRARGEKGQRDVQTKGANER